MKKQKTLKVLFFLVLFLLVSTKKAYAYLDPGTGSYILQILAAGALGGLFAVKTFWRQIIDFLRRIFSKKNNKKQTSVKKQKNAKK